MFEGVQVAGETGQHVQHRIAVLEENVAPHDRVGGGDAGEVAETASGELENLRA
jgi:hypothetical protein